MAEETCMLRSFPRQFEAELMHGRLIQAGIDARLARSGGKGPWRLEVPAAVEAQARAVLDEDQSALVEELFADDPDEAAVDRSRCPSCGSDDRVDLRETQNRILRAMGRPYWMKRWRCRTCGTRWR
jgi:hypothetical protein